MRWFQILLLSAVFWCAGSFAKEVNYNERQELQTIASWMNHLNYHFPDLQVSVTDDLSNPESRVEVLDQLQLLEGVMQGDFSLPDASLKQIACGKPVCDGGDGGKCKMCM